MAFNPQNPLAGFTMNPLTPIPESQMTGRDPNRWAQALAILGATLQDVGAGVGGRQANALSNLQQRQDQKKLQDRQDLAQASLSSTLIDSARAGAPPSINSLLPALAQMNPSLAVQLLGQTQKGPELLRGRPGDQFFDPRDPSKPIAAVPTAPERPDIREVNGQLGVVAPTGFTPIPGAPEKPGDAGTPAHQDALNLGLKPGTPEYNSYLRDRTLPKPAQTNVSVTNPGNTFASGIGTAAVDLLKENNAGARAATSVIDNANQIRAALDSGKVVAGPTASWGVFARQVFGTDQEGLLATREVIRGMAEATVNARQLLRGQGTVTDREQLALEKARSGDIDSMTVEEIRLVANATDRLARTQIKNNKQYLERARKVPNAPADYLSLFDVDEPEPYKSAPKSQPQPSGDGGAAIARVMNEADYSRLAPGTRYVDPNGVERMKR